MQQQSNITCLAPDTLVDCYEIREVLNIDIYSISYKAWDTRHNRLVILREYFPTEIAVRADNATLIEATESSSSDFQYGLDQFIDESNTLSKFHHQNIIGIQNHLQTNNTGYLCMPSVQGQALTKKLIQHAGTLPEKDLVAIIKAIVSGLQYSHERNHFHYNISPDTIYIRDTGSPALINFGSAQRAIAVRLKKIPAISCSGYTPSELYGNNLSKIGPWSDLYALGGIIYKCISGQAPINAKTRHHKIYNKKLVDSLVPATTIAQGLYSKDLLSLTDWMLAPAITDRPQSTSEVLFKLNQNPSVFDIKTTSANVFPPVLTRSIISKTEQQSLENIIHKSTTLDLSSQSTKIKQQSVSTTKDETVSTVLPPQPVETGIRSNSNITKKSPAIDLISQSVEKKPTSNQSKYWLSFTLICIIIVVISINQKQNLHQLFAYIENKFAETTDQNIKQDSPDLKALVKNKVEEEPVKKEQQQKQELPPPKTIAKQLPLKKSQEIQNYLAKAEADIKQLRLTSPKGNNALEKYLQILQLQPENKQAQLGMLNISNKYLELTNRLLQQHKFVKAKQYLKKARTIHPGNPKVIDAENNLKTAEKTYSIKSTNPTRSILFRSTKKPFNIEMVWVNPGCFQMGDNEIYATEHRVCLTSGYFLGMHEVTQAQWHQIMGNTPSIFKGNNKPVENVSWNEVQTFIRKLNEKTNQHYRLPTEAEWEYACRSGGKKQNYCGSNNANSVAWHKENSENTVHPVGQKQANSIGLFDMSGNVWEWVQDGYSSSYYNISPINDPKGPSRSMGHVVRGGSWFSGIDVLHSAYRIWYGSNVRVSYLGFRLARSL